jgi:hypothetical protein
MKLIRLSCVLPLFATPLVAASCASTYEPDEPTLGTAQEAIKKGTLVTNPTGAALNAVKVGSPIGGCSGTLLRPTWVLTARHCIESSVDGSVAAPSTVTVSHDTLGSQQAKRVEVPPDLNIDVALIELNGPLDTGVTLKIFRGLEVDSLNRAFDAYGYGLLDAVSSTCTAHQHCRAGYFCDDLNDRCTQPSAYGNCQSSVTCSSNLQCSNAFGDGFVCNAGSCCGGSSALRTAKITPTAVRRYGGNWTDNKTLLISDNSSGQGILSGDSGGGLVLGSSVIGVIMHPEVVAYNDAFRAWAMGLIDPRSFVSMGNTKHHNDFGHGDDVVAVGDVGGPNSQSDYISIVRSGINRGKVFVSLHQINGTHAPAVSWYSGSFVTTSTQVPLVGDFNGDMVMDIGLVDPTARTIQVSTSTGSAFATKKTWRTNIDVGSVLGYRVGDLTGDTLDDIVIFRSNGIVDVLPSCGTQQAIHRNGCTTNSTFGPSIRWATGFATSIFGIPAIGDFNADGQDDIMLSEGSGGTIAVFVALTKREDCVTDADCSDNYCWDSLGVCPITMGQRAGAKTLFATYPAGTASFDLTGDINRDGYDDLIHAVIDGPLQVGLGSAAGFQPLVTWRSSFLVAGDFPVIDKQSRVDDTVNVVRFVRDTRAAEKGFVYVSAGNVF